MTESPTTSDDNTPQPNVRYEATVHRGDRRAAMNEKEIAHLDVDRLPSTPDELRVLLTPEESARLVEEGYEVRLLRARAVQPLGRDQVVDDDAARAWLEERVEGIEREGDA